MQKIGFIVAIVASALCGVGIGWLIWGRSPAPPQPSLDLNINDGAIYRVRAVVDGDTITLENGLHIRYNGVNAPEMGHFVRDRAPLAEEATVRNTKLVEGKRVRLKLSKDPLDIYGRVCARVFVIEGDEAHPTKETDVGAVLLQEGLAKTMGLGVTSAEMKELKQIEDSAKEAKVGIWGLEKSLRGADGSAKPYCAAERSPLYHLVACPSAKKISPANLHLYASAEEAEAAGYKPCKCVPK